MALGEYDRAAETFVKAMEVAPTDADLLNESKLCRMVPITVLMNIVERRGSKMRDSYEEQRLHCGTEINATND